MTARVWGDHGCRRYGGCRPGSRCPEHSGAATPVPIGHLIAQALAHIGQHPDTAGQPERAAR